MKALVPIHFADPQGYINDATFFDAPILNHYVRLQRLLSSIVSSTAQTHLQQATHLKIAHGHEEATQSQCHLGLYSPMAIVWPDISHLRFIYYYVLKIKHCLGGLSIECSLLMTGPGLSEQRSH